jgi:hypothetical protein
MPLQEVVVEGESPVAHSAAAAAAAAASAATAGAAAAGSAAAAISTPDTWELGIVSGRHRPLERIDSDPEQQQQQQQQQQQDAQQQRREQAAPCKLTAQAVRQITSPFAACDVSGPASDRVQRSAGGLTGSNLGSNLGSNFGVRGSSLGSTDTVSRVYSWMGSSGAAAAAGQQTPGTMNLNLNWNAASAGNGCGNGSAAAGGRKPVEAAAAGLREKRAETWLVQVRCLAMFFVVVVCYKGGKIYWLAIHSNQRNLIVRGLWHRCHQQTRQAPLFQEVPSTRTKNSRGVGNVWPHQEHTHH